MGRRNADGLVGPRARPGSYGREVTALASDADGWLVLVDGREVLRVHGDEVETHSARSRRKPGRCLLPVAGGVLRRHGRTRGSRCSRTARSRWSASVRRGRRTGRPGTRRGEARPTRDRSPLGRTAPCSRTSTSAGSSGRRRPKGSGQPTIDIDADVHQVLADRPRSGSRRRGDGARPRGVARDGGGPGASPTEGLHAPYARAVALDGDAPVPERLHRPARRPRWRSTGGSPGRTRFEQVRGRLAGVVRRGTSTATASPPRAGPSCSGRRTASVFVSEDGGDSWRRGARMGSTRVDVRRAWPPGRTGT